MISIGLRTVGESCPSDSPCCDYVHHPFVIKEDQWWTWILAWFWIHHGSLFFIQEATVQWVEVLRQEVKSQFKDKSICSTSIYWWWPQGSNVQVMMNPLRQTAFLNALESKVITSTLSRQLIIAQYFTAAVQLPWYWWPRVMGDSLLLCIETSPN